MWYSRQGRDEDRKILHFLRGKVLLMRARVSHMAEAGTYGPK
jgi:hypothetical protein